MFARQTEKNDCRKSALESSIRIVVKVTHGVLGFVVQLERTAQSVNNSSLLRICDDIHTSVLAGMLYFCNS